LNYRRKKCYCTVSGAIATFGHPDIRRARSPAEFITPVQGGTIMASPRAPRPLIGINADYLPATKSAGPIARLAVGYADAIFQSGGIPVVLTPCPKDLELDPIVDRLDGIVLTGGLDMDPRPAGHPP